MNCEEVVLLEKTMAPTGGVGGGPNMLKNVAYYALRILL